MSKPYFMYATVSIPTDFTWLGIHFSDGGEGVNVRHGDTPDAVARALRQLADRIEARYGTDAPKDCL